MKHLTGLDMECNNITSVPWQELATSCRRLRVLNLQSNEISSVEKSIKSFRELIQLNISHNKLTAVPVELFSLRKLQHLDTSHNQISRLPQYNLSQQRQHMMDLVDLSYNNIYKFSDWLLFISWCTDLSANKIVTIPGSTIKHMDYETTQRLVLRENPIRSPPFDICMAGLPAIIKHFQEIKNHSHIYQGCDLLMIKTNSVGPEVQWGKPVWCRA
ncbi:LRRC63 [Bugula neritina]|uniref:LRRC63 n=1 Tax=Bugula neritina TaxID=10212 RepID=A0A7J7JMM4_BUGNE|nr:LRRC63 [Bugula neritina]